MDVTIDTGLKMANLAIVLFSTTLNVYLFFKAKSDKRFQSIEETVAKVSGELSDDIATHANAAGALNVRLSILEKHVSSLPTHDDTSEIHKRISDLASSMSAISERSKNTNDAVKRIEQYLLSKGNP